MSRSWASPRQGWPTILLCLLTVYAAARAVAAAGWSPHDSLLPWLALLGALVGILAALSPLRLLWASLLGAALGIEAVVLAHARAVPGQSWAEQLDTVAAIGWRWLAQAQRAGPSYDPLIVGLLLGSALFLVGFGTAWLIFRRESGWWALILTSGFGVVHLSYATVDSIAPFLIAIVLGVLLVASLELHLRRHAWHAAGVPVAGAALGWTLVSAAMLAGLALFLATRLPAGAVHEGLASAYHQLTAPWRDFQSDLERLVGGPRGQARPADGLVFSQTLVPREDFELGSQPVLRVLGTERHYWRTASYDRYDGRSIQNTAATERHYDDRTELPRDPAGALARAPVQYSVTVLAPGASALFSPDAPLSFNLPLVVSQRIAAWDIAATRAPSPIQRGQGYTVVALTTRAGWRDLAQANPDYPDWLDRYLELPTTLPPRVGALANRLTQDALTPLDRVLAVEAHLRSLTYSTHAVVPPLDRDWVDFTLFDSGVGYCDYLATAMTVLLRTQGIPARVASGFAPGELEDDRRSRLIRESDAHSWTEVYFPGFGWQTFEPSAVIARPERPDLASNAASARSRDQSSAGLTEPETEGDEAVPGSAPPPVAPGALGPLAGPILWSGLLLLCLGAILGLFSAIWSWRLRSEPPSRRRFGQLLRCLRWAGRPSHPELTPNQLADALSLDWPELAPPLRRLVEAYNQVSYGGPSPAADQRAEAAWQELVQPLTTQLIAERLHKRHPSPRPSRSVMPRN